MVPSKQCNMPNYYYEYVQPKNNSYDPENPNPTNPNNYELVYSGTVYAQNERIADKMIKSDISNVYPQYMDYDYGIMMFTEDDGSEFTESDWIERLKRAVTSPKDTIHIDLDEE